LVTLDVDIGVRFNSIGAHHCRVGVHLAAVMNRLNDSCVNADDNPAYQAGAIS
jgi:hypothetical protein